MTIPLIDLHMHTTASDGRLTPAELVRAVQSAGIQTFAVADHDTVAAVEESARLAAAAGLLFVSGVEITAVQDGRDVHMLGYFVDHESEGLLAFLEASRSDRLRRARQMCDALRGLGVPVDFDDLLTRTGGPGSPKSLARPAVARALVEAGHVTHVQEAFDLYLAEGRPAYVGRAGASPAEVVQIIHRGGGLASLAHPGPLCRDELIAPLAAAGLDAIECFHSEHSAETTEKYLALAREHGLAVTGGSDFHGPDTRRADGFGRIGLPPAHFALFAARAGRRFGEEPTGIPG